MANLSKKSRKYEYVSDYIKSGCVVSPKLLDIFLNA